MGKKKAAKCQKSEEHSEEGLKDPADVPQTLERTDAGVDSGLGLHNSGVTGSLSVVDPREGSGVLGEEDLADEVVKEEEGQEKEEREAAKQVNQDGMHELLSMKAQDVPIDDITEAPSVEAVSTPSARLEFGASVIQQQLDKTQLVDHSMPPSNTHDSAAHDETLRKQDPNTSVEGAGVEGATKRTSVSSELSFNPEVRGAAGRSVSVSSEEHHPIQVSKGRRVASLRLPLDEMERKGGGGEGEPSTTPSKPAPTYVAPNTPNTPATANGATARNDADEVLERAERAMGILDDFIMNSARCARKLATRDKCVRGGINLWVLIYVCFFCPFDYFS